MQIKKTWAIATLILLFCISTTSQAIPIFQVRGISLNTGGMTVGAQGPTSSFLNFDPFDPTLGTLDSVGLSMQVTLTTILNTAQNFIQGGTGSAIPFPYQVTGSTKFELGPLSPVSLLIPFEDPNPYTASGVGEVFTSTDNLTSNVLFDSTSDFVGIVFDGRGTMSGLRSDFIQTLPGLDLIFQPTISGSYIGTSPIPSTVSIFGAGTIILQYNYTPFSTSTPGGTVPEPTPIALLASGLLGFGYLRRRRLS